jgi:hypothetical protein
MKEKKIYLSLFLLLPGPRHRRDQQPLLLLQLLLRHVRDVEPVRDADGERHAEPGVGIGEILRVKNDELGLLCFLVKDVGHQKTCVFGAAIPPVGVGHERRLAAVAALAILERRDDGLGGVSGEEVDFGD